MKILHISSSDISGGAARAAYRLHEGLRRVGEDSGMLVLRKRSKAPSVRRYEPSTRLTGRVVRKVRRWSQGTKHTFRPLGNRSLEAFSTDRSDFGSEILAHIGEPGVINLHWVAGAFDYSAFFARVPPHIPLVWTLHDMNPFTGGCHFDGGCGRFEAACGRCPQLESDRENDLSRQVWSRKHAALQALSPGRLTIVAPSMWLADQARKSSVLGRFPIECIPYGLDTDVFKPRNRHAIRDVLGIPQNAEVVLFVAGSLANRRKGFDLLGEALSLVRQQRDVWLLSVGRGDAVRESDVAHSRVEHSDDDQFLSHVYSAADVFVIPSREDNLPNTAIESLACGVPVVGFDVGGIKDIVRPGATGVLASAGNAAALATGLGTMLDRVGGGERLAETCRAIACTEYAIDVQARAYAAVYRRVTAGSTGVTTLGVPDPCGVQQPRT